MDSVSTSTCLIESDTRVTGAWLTLPGTLPAFGPPSRPGMGDKIHGLEL